MATTCLTNNFRKGLLVGNYDMDTDVIKCALYNGGGARGFNTGAYATTDEASGTGYTAGGVTMAGVTQATDTTNNVSYLDWTTDPSWASSTITATDCLIWDDTTVTNPATDASCYVGDFGGSKSSSSGTFTVVLPAPAYNTAIIRLA